MKEEEFDKLIYVLRAVQHGQSFRRIGRFLRHHQDTVKSMYVKALELDELGELDNFAKGRRYIDLRYVGDTSDVEYIDGAINHNVCGGGRKVVQDNKFDK